MAAIRYGISCEVLQPEHLGVLLGLMMKLGATNIGYDLIDPNKPKLGRPKHKPISTVVAALPPQAVEGVSRGVARVQKRMSFKDAMYGAISNMRVGEQATMAGLLDEVQRRAGKRPAFMDMRNFPMLARRATGIYERVN